MKNKITIEDINHCLFLIKNNGYCNNVIKKKIRYCHNDCCIYDDLIRKECFANEALFLSKIIIKSTPEELIFEAKLIGLDE